MTGTPVQAPPSLDEENAITPWQSATIRHIAKGFVAAGVGIILKLTGKHYDPESTAYLVNNGVELLLGGLQLWWYYRAAKARINATKIIRKDEL